MSDAPPLPHTANLLGALAWLVHDRVQQALEKETGRAESASAAVLTIGTRPAGSIDALSRSLGLSHSTTVRLVESLARQGLVEKRPGKDRRSACLDLTQRGRELFSRLLDVRRAVLERSLQKLSEDDRQAMHRALTTLLEQTAETRRQAQRICRLCEHDLCRPCPVGSTIRAAGKEDRNATV